mmetsp:Transcript_53601/g.120054  ORF Transcript_53601/g.120054 Transcript_53601/m.120054 type:complete len:103 (-) Transcript_53601:252-560(-)
MAARRLCDPRILELLLCSGACQDVDKALELVGAQPGPCARDSSWDSVPRTRSFNLPVLTRDPAAIERKRNAIIQLLVAYVVKPATEVTESEEFEHGSNTNLA